MTEKTVKIFINLEKEIATVQVIRRIPLFNNPAKRFIIESDMGGFSAIEKRENGYYVVNYLRDRDTLGKWKPTGEFIDEKPLTEKEVKETIREVLLSKLN